MSDLMKEFLKDGQATEPTDKELTTIRKLACDQRDWEKKVKQLTVDLENAQESLKQIQEYLLPNAMSSVGMSEFKMLDGSKITVKNDIYASIRKDYIGEAVGWLEDNGLGGIVKDDVTVKFGRGEKADADIVLAFCRNHGFNADEKVSIHPQTLAATVREQLEKGIQFPEEFFSVAPKRKAIIK